MRTYICFFLVLILSNSIPAQHGAFYSLTSSRFARATGLGNVFTGIAEGAEAAYYNNAGLAFENNIGFAYSNGFGFNLRTSQPTGYNVAFCLPINILNGSISGYILNTENEFTFPFNATVVNLSYSRIIFAKFAIGFGLIYQHANPVPNTQTQINRGVVDAMLSGLYKSGKFKYISETDEITVGFRFNNILSTDLNSREFNHFSANEFRIGLSYKIRPEILYNDIYWFKFLIASDVVWHLNDYNSGYLAPNFGFEFTFLEIFSARYGREQREEVIWEGKISSRKFNIRRLGLGFKLPLNRLFLLKKKFYLALNCVFSDWKEIVGLSCEDPFMTAEIVYQLK